MKKNRNTFMILAATGLLSVAYATGEPSASLTLELDREVLPADTENRAVLKIAVEPPAALTREDSRAPVNLCIVLDRSGSMNGSKIEHARLAAIEAIRRLGPDDVFSLVTYDTEIETVVPAQRIRDIERIESLIRGIHPHGMTALYGGVNQGASELRKHLDGRHVHRMILLSDGIANVGPSSPDELERLGAALLREKISVTTIGVGLDYNEDLMTRLARASDGNTYFVEGSQDLPRILSEELGDALNVVGRDVILRIELGEGIRPLGIIGREGRVHDREIEIPLHQIYGGRERFALVEVEVEPGADQTRRGIGKAELHYEDVARQERQEVRQNGGEILFSRDAEQVAASMNKRVQTDLLEARAAEARQRAIEFDDRGDRPAAARELMSASRAMQESAAVLGDDALAAEAHRLEEEAGKVERDGIDNPQRKAYRARIHQDQTQQSTRD